MSIYSLIEGIARNSGNNLKFNMTESLNSNYSHNNSDEDVIDLPLKVVSIFTHIAISPSLWLRQYSNRYTIRAGRNLPDKEFLTV